VVANLKYSGHLISVSTIFDTPNKYQFTPVVEIRCGDSAGVLNTILTDHVFIIQEKAIELGFKLGREWIDKQLLESPRVSHRERQMPRSTETLLEQSQRLQDLSSALHDSLRVHHLRLNELGAFSKEAIGQLSRNSSATPDSRNFTSTENHKHSIALPSCTTTFLPNSQKFADHSGDGSKKRYAK